MSSRQESEKSGPVASRLRALVYVPNLRARGGAERQSLMIATVFKDLNFQVSVAFRGGDAGELRSIAQYFDIDLTGVVAVDLPEEVDERLPEAVRLTLNTIRDFRLIKSLKPDYFVNSMFKSYLGASGRSSVYYVHFPHSLEPRQLPRLKRAYVRLLAHIRRFLASGGRDHPATYGLILANSRYTATHIEREWGIKARVLEPACVVPAVPGNDREKWILAVGRFQAPGLHVPHKNQHTLVNAFAGLRDLQEQGWKLHLAGSVGSRDELERIRQLSNGMSVEIHPNASNEELRQLYERSSIYWHAQGYGEDEDLYPEAHEHFGMSVVEAIGAGLLPLVYESAGPKEIVAPLEGGYSWRTVAELRERTRAFAGMGGTETAERRAQVRDRALDFDLPRFRREMIAIIESSEIS